MEMYGDQFGEFVSGYRGFNIHKYIHTYSCTYITLI